MKNKILTITFIIMLFAFIITFSIGLPIYFRPFYYMQVKSLNIVETSGFTKDVIIDAYNSVMTYLTVPFTKFSVGTLNYSQEGMQHFVDCKVLFNLNLSILLISLTSIIVLLILNKKNKFTFISFFGRTPLIFAGVCGIVIPVFIGLVASIDFTKAFVIFHKIFFPGKDNWIFDPYIDEIINILPQNFFMNCALLIASSVVIISIGLIIADVLIIKKRLKEN